VKRVWGTLKRWRLRWEKGVTALPTKEELEKRMPEQLEYFGNSDTVHALWKGYLAALAEVGVLSPDVYNELNALLRNVGEAERLAIFLGYPGQYE
jgi:hypothetical protein